jgi:hypothetical protein
MRFRDSVAVQTVFGNLAHHHRPARLVSSVRRAFPVFAVIVSQAVAVSAQNPHDEITWTGPDTCLECHEDEAIEVHGSVMYQWQGAAPEIVNGPSVQGKDLGWSQQLLHQHHGQLGRLRYLPRRSRSTARVDGEPRTARQRGLHDLSSGVLSEEEGRGRVRARHGGHDNLHGRSSTDGAPANAVQLPAVPRQGRRRRRGEAWGSGTGPRGDDGSALRRPHGDHRREPRVSGLPHHDRPPGRRSRLGSAPVGHDRVRRLHRLSRRNAGLTSRVRNPTPPGSCGVPDLPHSTLRQGRRRYHGLGSDGDAPDLARDARYRAALSPDRGEIQSADPDVPLLEGHQPQLPVARGRGPGSGHRSIPHIPSVGHPANPDSKLYAFKYKTAQQPKTISTHTLIALDTSVFFATADGAAATVQGLSNMGLDPNTPYEWIETDTLQMLNHQVGDDDSALRCTDCHGGQASGRIDLVGELGFAMWGSEAEVCEQCHGPEPMPSFEELHGKHVTSEGYDCSWCHGFSRPERGLTPSTALFRDGFSSGATFAWSDTAPW